jgi:hypothetical protein
MKLSGKRAPTGNLIVLGEADEANLLVMHLKHSSLKTHIK